VPKCCDPDVLSRFWCAVWDFMELDPEEEARIETGSREAFASPQPTIFLTRDDEPQNGQARLHIDVNPIDRNQNAERERLLAAGAELVDIVQPSEASWHGLADPEGNEFCLLKRRLASL
jgi:Glyoxalase-like domain